MSDILGVQPVLHIGSLREAIREEYAGFVYFGIPWRKGDFGFAPQAGIAENFGTLGINLRARKTADEAELAAAMTALSREIPINGREEVSA